MQKIIPMIDRMLADGISGPTTLGANWFHWAARTAHKYQHEQGSKHTHNLAQAYLKQLYENGQLTRNSQKLWVKIEVRRMSGAQRRAMHQNRLARKARYKRTPAVRHLRLLDQLGRLQLDEQIAA